ncbi:MAG: hypothetical protein ACXADH_08885, partial [Candidatus Kariarchaeaceae archaeon]
LIVKHKAGEFVKKGDPIITLYSSRESALDNALQIANLKPPFRQEGMVLERITAGSIDLD